MEVIIKRPCGKSVMIDLEFGRYDNVIRLRHVYYRYKGKRKWIPLWNQYSSKISDDTKTKLLKSTVTESEVYEAKIKMWNSLKPKKPRGYKCTK